MNCLKFLSFIAVIFSFISFAFVEIDSYSIDSDLTECTDCIIYVGAKNSTGGGNWRYEWKNVCDEKIEYWVENCKGNKRSVTIRPDKKGGVEFSKDSCTKGEPQFYRCKVRD